MKKKHPLDLVKNGIVNSFSDTKTLFEVYIMNFKLGLQSISIQT